MKKHFIVCLLLLNVTCAMQATLPDVMLPDAFEAGLNHSLGSDEYEPQKSAVQKILYSIAERMPDQVMFALVVAYCKYDGFKQQTCEKFNCFIDYLRSKILCRCIEQNEQWK